MPPSPEKLKTKEISGDQEGDKQYPTPGFDNDLQPKFSQEHVWC